MQDGNLHSDDGKPKDRIRDTVKHGGGCTCQKVHGWITGFYCFSNVEKQKRYHTARKKVVTWEDHHQNRKEKTMGRLIDADDLFDRVEALSKDAGFYEPIYRGFQALISNAPTVDAVEVVHGRWGEPYKIHGFDIMGRDCPVCGHTYGEVGSNYCPNCGTKMDLKEGDEK